MKKCILIFLVFFTATVLTSADNGAALFTTINNSSDSTAMGMKSGVANIWSNNPLEALRNPAKLAYMKGY